MCTTCIFIEIKWFFLQPARLGNSEAMSLSLIHTFIIYVIFHLNEDFFFLIIITFKKNIIFLIVSLPALYSFVLMVHMTCFKFIKLDTLVSKLGEIPFQHVWSIPRWHHNWLEWKRMSKIDNLFTLLSKTTNSVVFLLRPYITVKSLLPLYCLITT